VNWLLSSSNELERIWILDQLSINSDGLPRSPGFINWELFSISMIHFIAIFLIKISLHSSERDTEIMIFFLLLVFS
jgi:hypothetical protein